jgi:hypothetical protein
VTRIVGGLKSFALFWWDFLVGDDWRIAAGVILALAGTAAIATTSLPAWWLVPVAVAALLGGSLRRAIRTRR